MTGHSETTHSAAGESPGSDCVIRSTSVNFWNRVLSEYSIALQFTVRLGGHRWPLVVAINCHSPLRFQRPKASRISGSGSIPNASATRLM